MSANFILFCHFLQFGICLVYSNGSVKIHKSEKLKNIKQQGKHELESSKSFLRIDLAEIIYWNRQFGTGMVRSTPVLPNLRLQFFRIFSKKHGFKNSELIFCYGSSFSDIACFEIFGLNLYFKHIIKFWKQNAK